MALPPPVRAAAADGNNLANMFQTLVDYFSKYENTYVKHDDAVIVGEVVQWKLKCSFRVLVGVLEEVSRRAHNAPNRLAALHGYMGRRAQFYGHVMDLLTQLGNPNL